MCGICGIAGNLRPGVIERMVDALRHRGPDDRGTHIDPAAAIALGNTRLSIVDLSETGHQPMQSPDGQVWITFNGEIYNHQELRAELGARHRFRGHSDTETILHAYLAWGKACVDRLNGMFAFAVWDRRSNELWLVRDRLGIKPLYYSVRGDELRFASEVRSILADPQWPRAVDLQAVDAFLRLRYVPHPHTLVDGIVSLPPATTLTWSGGTATLASYWSPGWDKRNRHTPDEAAERFSTLLNQSVRLNLMSDVPLGVFVSGGLDSTLVTAMAREHVPSLQAFSVAFEGDDEDSRGAAATSASLGCSHTVVPCTPMDIHRLPDIAAAMDMPVGDAVILPMFMLNEAAGRNVKVVLTGEGADELLMGYAHQAQLLRLASLRGLLDLPGVVGAIKLATRMFPARFWDLFFSYGSSLGPAGVERMLRLVQGARSASRSYINYTSLFDEDERMRLYSLPLAQHAAQPSPAGFDLGSLDAPGLSLRRALMQLELSTWLPDNILTKQDSLGMANSVEARVPYLDHRLVEEVTSWDEPTFAAVAGNKNVLRHELGRRWPALARRRKRAFRLDFHPPLRPKLVQLVNETVLSGGAALGDLVSEKAVRDLIADFDRNSFLRGKQLAALVVLEAWLRANLKMPSAAPGAALIPDAATGGAAWLSRAASR